MQRRASDRCHRRRNQDEPERQRKPAAFHLVPVHCVHHEERPDRRRDASDHQPSDDPEVGIVLRGMDRPADGLRRAGEPEIGADRRGRGDAENEDQERRHQRTAANARHSYEESDQEAGQGVG